jgi:ubiquinone/menaquinone biosynthesis C-methylase UbiE
MHKPTIEAYDKHAQAYDDEVVEFWDNFPKDFIREFVHSVPGKRVLNLGSGSGRDAVLLRDRGMEVHCVDGSSSMVEMTKKLGFASEHTTFDKLDYPAESFDAVWAYTSLLHIPEAEMPELLTRIHRWLKPGGVFATGMIRGDGAELVERETMPGTKRLFQYYHRGDLKGLITAHKFKILYSCNYQPGRKIYMNHLYKALA